MKIFKKELPTLKERKTAKASPEAIVIREAHAAVEQLDPVEQPKRRAPFTMTYAATDPVDPAPEGASHNDDDLETARKDRDLVGGAAIEGAALALVDFFGEKMITAVFGAAAMRIFDAIAIPFMFGRVLQVFANEFKSIDGRKRLKSAAPMLAIMGLVSLTLLPGLVTSMYAMALAAGISVPVLGIISGLSAFAGFVLKPSKLSRRIAHWFGS